MSRAILRAEHRDAHQVAAVIAAAFRDLHVTTWLVAHPDDRLRVLYAHLRIHVEHALDHGTVLMTAERTAVAVWLPRDASLPPIPGYDQRLEDACGRYAERFRTFDAVLDKHHPAADHHHLALLAVEPDHQRQGLGTALLTRSHALLDRLDMPAYLEATSEQARRLYLRHGYDDHGPPIVLPDHGLRLWPLWRPPQPHRPARN